MANRRLQTAGKRVWTLLNPVADAEVEQFRPANRVPDLNGKTIGLFWNGKPNGDVFLNRVAERLKTGFNALTVVRMWDVDPETKTALGNTMDNLNSMAQRADLILGASGD